MKKNISVILIIIVFFTFTFLFENQTIVAEENVEEDTKKLVLNSAKLALGLYLAAKLGDIFTSRKSNNIEEEKLPNDSSSYNNQELANKVFVIDPGHGGHDPGAVGPGGIEEKDINLETALELYEILKLHTTAEIYLTRSSDKFLSLSERIRFTREKNADIFISIHYNADTSGRKRGIETYAYYSASRETWALAWSIHEAVVRNLNLIDRGLMVDNFQVIRELTDCKAILLELGYISNPAEEKILKKPETIKTTARSIYEGLKNYYN
ncbi:MAG: N-acetylmuramoyl-L-alanine amidase family protein [Bacillota bacterium]